MRKVVLATDVFKPHGKFKYSEYLEDKNFAKPYTMKFDPEDPLIKVYSLAIQSINLSHSFLNKVKLPDSFKKMKVFVERPLGIKVIDDKSVLAIFPQMVELKLGVVLSKTYAEASITKGIKNASLKDLSVLPILNVWKSMNSGTGEEFLGKVPEKYRMVDEKVIYRGITGLTSKQVKSLKDGKSIILPKHKIVSFSLDKKVAKKFADSKSDGPGILYKKKVVKECIVLNIGKYCMDLGIDESDFGMVGNEKEIVIHQNEYYLSVSPDEVVQSFNFG